VWIFSKAEKCKYKLLNENPGCGTHMPKHLITQGSLSHSEFKL